MQLDPSAYTSIVENLHDGLYLVDKNRVIEYWNHAAELMTGFKSGEVVGHACSDNILNHCNEAGECLCSSMCPLAATMEDKIPRSAEIYLHHKDGHRVPVSVRVTPLLGPDGQVVGGIELFTDISSYKANELKILELEKMAKLDALTRLANRRCIDEELAFRAHEHKTSGIPVGLLFVDVDHFKKFNDTHGHAVGDQVLKLVAATMLQCASPFDLVGRWGGEEFVIILRNASVPVLAQTAEKFRALVESTYLMAGDARLAVTISVGGTMLQENESVEAFAARADACLYASKKAGRNRVTLG